MGFQQTFKALSDPTRREILRLLRDGEMSAGDLSSHFPALGRPSPITCPSCGTQGSSWTKNGGNTFIMNSTYPSSMKFWNGFPA